MDNNKTERTPAVRCSMTHRKDLPAPLAVGTFRTLGFLSGPNPRDGLCRDHAMEYAHGASDAETLAWCLKNGWVGPTDGDFNGMLLVTAPGEREKAKARLERERVTAVA